MPVVKSSRTWDRFFLAWIISDPPYEEYTSTGELATPPTLHFLSP